MRHQFMILIRKGLARLKTGALCLALAACSGVTSNDNRQTNGDVGPSSLSLIAGSIGGNGTLDAIGSDARFNFPLGITVDGSGNLYVADTRNHTIRKISPAGVVTTFAGMAGVIGSNDGTGAAAQFRFPSGITIDGSGNLYVADTRNQTIRKISPAGLVTTLAGTAGVIGSNDGTGAAAQFQFASGITIDGSGNLYVADTENHTIRKISPAGVVTTLAGTAGAIGGNDGTGAAARFQYPSGITVDGSGNLRVADTQNHTIRKISPAGVVTTLAGTAGSSGSADGTGAAARLQEPSGITTDGSGNLYVADAGNQTIRVISPAGATTTLAGTAVTFGAVDGTGAAAQFEFPAGVTADGSGNLYVVDTFNHTIRKISPAGMVTTFAGTAGVFGSKDGTGAAARFQEPGGITIDGSGNLYVTDVQNQIIRKISPAGVVTTFAGMAGIIGSNDGTGGAAQFQFPLGITIDGSGNVYVTDTENQTIRKISPAGVVTTFAGMAGVIGSNDGTGGAAQFQFPLGITIDGSGNLYVADTVNQTIRKISPAGVVTTLAGTAGSPGSNDGTGAAARFQYPTGITIDDSGNLYVADSENNTIREITPAGVVSTVAGVAGRNGIVLGNLPGGLSNPYGITVAGPKTLALTAGNGVLKLVLP